MNEKPWEIPFTKERLLNAPPGCCPYCYKSYSTQIHKAHIKDVRAREEAEKRRTS